MYNMALAITYIKFMLKIFILILTTQLFASDNDKAITDHDIVRIRSKNAFLIKRWKKEFKTEYDSLAMLAGINRLKDRELSRDPNNDTELSITTIAERDFAWSARDILRDKIDRYDDFALFAEISKAILNGIGFKLGVIDVKLDESD